jgi:hypothetical protein
VLTLPSEAQIGSRRLLDHLSFALAGLAAAAIVGLGHASALSIVCAAGVVAGAASLWWCAPRQAVGRETAVADLLRAQAQLGDSLIPAWRGQIGVACQQMSLAVESLATRLGALAQRLAPPPPGTAAHGPSETALALEELREAALLLQFHDRVAQILGHVCDNIELTTARLGDSRRDFERDGSATAVDVQALVAALKHSYTMSDEEGLPSGGHGHGSPDEITYF